MNPTVYATRSIPAYRSDLYNIPYGNVVLTGVNNPGPPNNISPIPGTTVPFTTNLLAAGLELENIVSNDTTGEYSAISSIYSDDNLFVYDNIFNAPGETFTIYQGENQGCLLYVANSDTNDPGKGTWVVDIKVLTASNNIVLFPDFPVGNLLPVKVLRVFETGTHTGLLDLIAIW